MAPPASVCGAIASDSRGLRHRAEGVGSNRGRLFRRRRALSLGMLGKGIVKRCTERIQQYTYVRTLGGGNRDKLRMYVRTQLGDVAQVCRMGGRAAGNNSRDVCMYVRKDVPVRT